MVTHLTSSGSTIQVYRSAEVACALPTTINLKEVMYFWS